MCWQQSCRLETSFWFTTFVFRSLTTKVVTSSHTNCTRDNATKFEKHMSNEGCNGSGEKGFQTSRRFGVINLRERTTGGHNPYQAFREQPPPRQSRSERAKYIRQRLHTSRQATAIAQRNIRIALAGGGGRLRRTQHAGCWWPRRPCANRSRR